MAKFNWRAKPTDDVRWRGSQRHYFTLYTISNLLIIPFVILIVVESQLHRKWLNYEENRSDYARGNWWFRIGMALLPDAILTLAASIGVATQYWHPIAALVSAISLFGLWLTVTVLNPLLAYSYEVSFTNRQTWENICYGEAAVQAIFTILYAAMIGYAAKGVHAWRLDKARKPTNVELSPRKLSESSSMDQNVYADARV